MTTVTATTDKIVKVEAPRLKAVALDIETSGLGWGVDMLCVSAAWIEWSGDGYELRSDCINTGYRGLFHQPLSKPEQIRWMERMLDGADIVFFHNGSFDVPYLVREKLLTTQMLWDRMFDTMLMARQTGGHESVSLEALCREYGVGDITDPEYHDMKSKRGQLAKLNPDAVMKYASKDTERTLQLGLILLALSLEQYDWEHVRFEGNYVLHISDMRVRGIRIDVPGIISTIERMKPRLRSIEKRLALGYNIHGPNDSTRLVRYLKQHRLSGYLGTTEGGDVAKDEGSLLKIPGVSEYRDIFNRPSVERGYQHDEADEARMAELLRMPGVEVAHLVLEGRDLTKKIGTWLQGYLDVMDDQWRVHPLWGAAGTVSYRLNCTEPNAQAVSKSLSIWGAAPGYKRLDGDFSQAELRLGAAMAKEHKMARMFRDGIDLHTGTAMEMYAIKDPAYFKTPDGKQKRRYAKTANFGGFYGGGAPALDRALHCGMPMALQIVKRWRDTFKGVAKASKDAEQRWKDRGYVILVHGTRLWASPDDLERRVYKAFNQVVQGSIATITKKAMMDLRRQLPEVHQVAQIHDALMMEIPDEGKDDWYTAAAREIMQDACPRHYLERTDPPIELLVEMELAA